MSQFRHYFLFLLIFLSCSNFISAQSLIFSGDSAIVISCENRPPDIDSHKIYNTTDETIGLRWKRTLFQLPAESDFFMIFDGAQYPPFVYEGIRGISAHDSVDIIFQFWHDTLVPGDSVIVQIMVYDEEDSLNTVHHLTVIQHCPLQTNNAEPEPENLLEVFPNPILTEATILVPGNQATTLVLFSTTGEILRQIPVPQNEITFSREGLSAGMYYIGMQQEGRLVGITKVVVVD